MKSKAQVLGHPIHPMLIVFPLGLFPAALVFDVAFVITRDAFWHRGAFWLLALGVLGTIAAAIPGLIDYTRTVIPSTMPGERARRTATWHLWTGVSVLVVGALVALGHYVTLDRTDVPWLAVGGNVLLNALLVAQGYLGGSLTYEHAIAVHPEPPGAPARPGRRARFE